MFSSGGGGPMKKHEEAKPKEKNTKQNKTKQYRVHFIGFPVFLSLALNLSNDP